MTPERRASISYRTHPCRLDVFGKTEAAGQRGVGEEGDLVDLAAAQGEHHHAPRLRAQVVAEGRGELEFENFCPNFCPQQPTRADLSRHERAENRLAER